MKLKALIFSLLLLSLASPSLRSQNYEVTVTTVNVWVKAVDKSGKPVEGLKETDFEIFEDNTKVPVTCFEEVKSVEPAAIMEAPEQAQSQSAPALPAPARKKFVVFLDLLNTSQREYLSIIPKIDQFMEQVSKAGWDAMIAGLTAEGKLGVMLQFTNNPQRAHAVLEKLQANPSRDLRLLKNERDLRNILGVGGGKAGDTMISQAFRQAKTYALQDKQMSKISLEAMESFASYLQNFNRNDHLVILYISGGINSDPARHYLKVMQQLTGMEGNATTFPEGVSETDFDIVKEVKQSIGRLNRSNITVYTINTRGMYVWDSDRVRDDEFTQDYQDSLVQIARETGGVAFLNSQNFGVGFDKILTDLNHQYLLCYNPPAHKKAQEYHKIRVEVKKPDVKVRHRQGYVG